MAKIMLVEDDKNLSAIYKDRLLAEGYEIVAAHDGEEALAMAVNEKPNLIISDVMMPKISGFDMLDILRSTPETKNTRVIMMTALSQVEDQQRAAKLGADKYLVKSQVTLDDVARVVREVLEGEGATVNAGVEATSQPSVTTEQAMTPTPPEPTQALENIRTAEPQAPIPVAFEPTVNEPSPTPQEYDVVNNQVSSISEQMQSTAEEKSQIENQIEQLANQLPTQPEPVLNQQPVQNVPVPPEVISAIEEPAMTTNEITSQPKPDIMKLYENEMANESASALSQPQTENQPTPTEPEAPAAPNPNDPHSISL